MESLGASWAEALRRGLCVYLEGDLGAGKTTLVRGMLRGLGYSEAVTSPTFTLVETYRLRGMDVHHIDLYRIEHPEELEAIGLRDLLTPQSVCLIEWPERGAGLLPPADVRITLEYLDGERRVVWQSATVEPTDTP